MTTKMINYSFPAYLKLQMNRRDSDKAGGQEIKSRISEY